MEERLCASTLATLPYFLYNIDYLKFMAIFVGKGSYSNATAYIFIAVLTQDHSYWLEHRCPKWSSLFIVTLLCLLSFILVASCTYELSRQSSGLQEPESAG